MVNLNAWQAPPGTISEAARAVRTWAHIQRNPVTITVLRESVEQDPQTVRITVTQGTREEGGVTVVVQPVVVFGVHGHPDDAIPDTDLQIGDVFITGDHEYEIVDVVHYPGSVQAKAMAR